MKISTLVYILLALALCGFVTYRIVENKEKKSASEVASAQKRPAKVTGMVLHPQAFSNSLSLSGSIDANEQIEIRSEVSGIVESINFTEGSTVQKGQVLFKVNDLEMRAQLAKARSAQALASENARRAELLFEKEAISREEFDVASADFQSAKAESQLISAQLGKATVRAPFSGKIGLRYISKGTYVSPTTLIANLVNTSKLKITFSIPEKYASQMKVGSPLSFTTSDSKDLHYAKIYAIEPGIEMDTRTLRMRAIAENSNGKLIPGTFANILLPLQKIDQALLVPTQALIPIQGGKKIFVARGGKAKEIIVETGARTNQNVLITSGLKAGDTILTTGVMSLKDGSPVQVKVTAANDTDSQ